MSRDREQLIKELINAKGNYKKEFEQNFPAAEMGNLLTEELLHRRRIFLDRYLGHLPSGDLHNLLELIKEDLNKPILTATNDKAKRTEQKR